MGLSIHKIYSKFQKYVYIFLSQLFLFVNWMVCFMVSRSPKRPGSMFENIHEANRLSSVQFFLVFFLAFFVCFMFVIVCFVVCFVCYCVICCLLFDARPCWFSCVYVTLTNLNNRFMPL